MNINTKLLLAQESAGQCALPDCRKSLASDGNKSHPVNIGEVAHIYGKKTGSARYKADMTDEARDSIDNLIFLCPNCHTKIGKQPEDYHAESLLRIKKEHIEFRDKQLAHTKVTFTDLDDMTKALVSGQYASTSDSFGVIPIEEKINKNGLSASVRSRIISGLSHSKEIERFIKEKVRLDPEFTERLKIGFRKKYLDLKQSESGDELFESMICFALDGQTEYKRQAASVAVLSYLFHICDVFEK